MSIQDEDGNEIVKLPGFWQLLAKFALLASVPVSLLGVSWAAWVTTNIWANKTEIAILKDARFRPNGAMSNTVNVGATDAAPDTADSSNNSASAKTWLTTQEVAKREKITDRTVLNYIEAGMIKPEPKKQGKTWVIAEDYRILPKLSAQCGTDPETENETEPEETTP